MMKFVGRQFHASRIKLILMAVIFGAISLPVVAQEGIPGSASTKSSAEGKGQPNAHKTVLKPYALEFRARNAQSYGHTFSIHGRVSAQGKFISPQVSGLHPATESPLPWMIGHVVAVPSETGASDGDMEDQYEAGRDFSCRRVKGGANQASGMEETKSLVQGSGTYRPKFH